MSSSRWSNGPGHQRSSRPNSLASSSRLAIWKRTQACTELTLPESHTACARVLALRQELAAAQSAQALEERIDEARRHLATAPVVGLSADPQVAGLAALLGTEEPSLRRALALLLAVLVEAGSAFGFALASAATANPPSPPPQTGATSRTTAVPGRAPSGSAPSGVVSFAERAARRKRGRRPATQPDASLVGWAAQCLRRDHRGCIGARATYQAYCRWAEGAGVSAVTETKFGRFMTGNIAAMGGKKVERRQGAFYVGVDTDLGAGSAGRQDGGMSKPLGRIVMGCQIRAARALLGWSRAQLAAAAGLNVNPSPIGRQTTVIPGRARAACLRAHPTGVAPMPVSSSSATPSRAWLAENANYVMRPPSRARARHGVKRVSAHLAVLRAVRPSLPSQRDASHQVHAAPGRELARHVGARV